MLPKLSKILLGIRGSVLVAGRTDLTLLLHIKHDYACRCGMQKLDIYNFGLEV